MSQNKDYDGHSGAVVLVFGVTDAAMVLGAKDLDNEKVAVNFYREVERGGYMPIDK